MLKVPRKTILNFIPKLKISNKELEAELFDIEIKGKKLSVFLKKLLASNFNSKEEIINFLTPSLKNLQNPLILKDLQEGVLLLKKAILDNRKILIFGDYDVDGSTSTALLINFFKDISFTNFDFFIPDRIEEGYGLNDKSLIKILEKDFDFLITLDCGTSSVKQIKELIKLGKTCLIIDHHKSSDILPECLVINPNRKDFFCKEFKDLCACGVLFLFLCKFFSEIKDKIPIIEHKNFMVKYLDLVALASICDVMPVVGQNRIFITNGLKNINEKKCNNGISKLIEVSGILENDTINAYHFGFIIGPKINAGGRIGKSNLGAKILSNLASSEEIEEIAYSLKQLNEERMTLEKQALEFIHLNHEKIVKQIEEFGFIFQYHNDWHEGIIGILSSRIKEKYHRPTFIGNLNIIEKKIKASSRSVGDVDIGDFILKANENSLIITGGGHKMAGGLTLFEEKFQDFMSFGRNFIKHSCDHYFENKEIIYNFDISLSAITLELAEEIEALQPFGNENPKPIFKIFDAKIKSYQILKDKHLKVLLSNGNVSQFAMCFNGTENEIGKQILLKQDLEFFVNISINHYNEKRYLSINIIDIQLK